MVCHDPSEQEGVHVPTPFVQSEPYRGFECGLQQITGKLLQAIDFHQRRRKNKATLQYLCRSDALLKGPPLFLKGVSFAIDLTT